MRKKLLSLLLAALMILGLLPAAALAAEGDTPPTLAEGVETSVKSYGYEDIAWELDLSTIFTDADGDALTYKVSVNGADPVEAAEKYSYVCGADNATLKFTANDGKADSDKTYTVTLNVEPKTKLLLESGSSEVAVGTPFTLAMSTIFENGYGVTVYVSINGADKEFVNSGNVKSVTFSRAFANPGVYTLEFYEKHGPTFVGPYTHTLTVTGEAIENHAPVVQNPTEGPGQLGSGVNRTQWKPDLASIFSDPDGDTLTYSRSIDGSVFSEYYTTVGIHADYLAPDGTHTVTIRATDPYGASAEFTVTIEKLTNHAPTKKADAPGKLSVFVPVGLTYKVDANLYYEDIDAKDQGKLKFVNKRYQGAGKYTASTAGDTTTETAYGADTSNVKCSSGIEITYTAIAIDKEDTATTGVAYTIDPAALGLNIPGNYKVRVSSGTTGGAEQSFNDTYAFIAKTPGTYVVHIYGDKTSTAEENYVVKLTVTGDYLEWPTIEKFELSTVTGAAVDGEDGNQTLTVKEIQIEQYEKLKDSTDGSKKIAGCITVTLDDSFVTKNRAQVKTGPNAVTLTASDGAKAGNTKPPKTFNSENDYTVEAAYYASQGSVQVWYTVKFVEPKSNTPPTLAEGVAESKTHYGYENQTWQLDLSKIFVDADGDALTYKVSVDGAAPVAAAEQYSYLLGTTGVKLKFTANDGKADSDKSYEASVICRERNVLLKQEGSSTVTTTTVFSYPMYETFKGTLLGDAYYVSIDGSEKEFFASGSPKNCRFSRAFANPGTYRLEFYSQYGTEFVGPYTHTLTVTGDPVENHAPYLLDTADTQKPTGDYWLGATEPHWRPDLTKVFADEDGYDTLSFTYKDDLGERFSTFYTGSTQPGYTMSKVGDRTVTIRATDPYGEHVDYTVQFTVKQDHRPVRKAGVLDAYTFEVPFGATLTLKADDYFEDTDEKDLNTEMKFYSPQSTTYTYKADGSAERVVTMVGCCDGYAGLAKTDGVTFTFRTVMPESWPTITGFSAETLYGTANSDTGAEEGKVNVKSVTVTQYDSLRVENGKASAGLILIRMDEDADTLERPFYELTGETADAVVSADAAIGAELKEDITLNAENNYRLAQAVSVSQNIENETYGNYTLTTYYDFMLVGVNARPILAVDTASVREKITLGDTWTLNLDGLFSDADGDPLTYKVSVNGAEAVVIEGSTYTLTPEDGVYTLVFTANDTKADSKDTYTVTLVTKNPGAPDWPQILEYNLTQELKVTKGSDATLYPAGTIPAVKSEVVQYSELVVDGSRTYAGEILIYVAEDFTAAGRSSYTVPKGSVTGKASNGATATFTPSRGTLALSKTNSYIDNYRVKVTEDGQNYYYYVKLAQAETPALEPVIGNGTNTGTTDNGVTTFPAGSGTGAPTVTVTAPANGWTVDENTFTVACEKACVVLVKSGETYTKLTAANSGETHSFTATLAEGDEIIVRLKGDVNGDGVISAADFGQAKAAALGYLSLSGANLHCATVSGGTSVRAADFGQIKAVALGNLTFKW